MISPIEMSDVLGKTQAVERAQHANKSTEDANYRQAHAAAEQLHQKVMGEANPADKNEQIENSLKGEKKDAHREKRKKRLRKQEEPDKDEQEMTNLGYKIDLVA